MMQVAFSSMTPTSFISAMTKSGGTKADCGTFASTTISTIDSAVSSEQGVLNALENGNNCAALGQTLVTSTKAAVVAAQGDLSAKNGEAKAALDAKETSCSATVGFSVGLELLESNAQCYDYSSQTGYTQAKAACDLKISALATADQTVVTAQTVVRDAKKAAADAVDEASRLMSGCLCRAHKAQTKAWSAARTAHASHAADWKQAHEILCALDSASTTCNVPTCPAVTKPTVATGVENADQNHCTEAPTQSASNAPTKAPTKSPTKAPTNTPTRDVDKEEALRDCNPVSEGPSKEYTMPNGVTVQLSPEQVFFWYYGTVQPVFEYLHKGSCTQHHCTEKNHCTQKHISCTQHHCTQHQYLHKEKTHGSCTQHPDTWKKILQKCKNVWKETSQSYGCPDDFTPAGSYEAFPNWWRSQLVSRRDIADNGSMVNGRMIHSNHIAVMVNGIKVKTYSINWEKIQPYGDIADEEDAQRFCTYGYARNHLM